MPRWRIGLTALFLVLAFQVASAVDSAPAAKPTATAPTPDPQLPARLALIRRQLASDDFAQRDAGQKLLDLIPPTQAATLRTLAAKESDPEVKARLDARIDAMDLYLLIHPPLLSLHVQNASMTEVANELRRQIGDSPTIVGAGSADFTLQVDNRPFWDIFAQLNQQTPLNVTSSISITAAGTTATFRLTAAPALGVVRQYKIVDTFAIFPQLTGTPATGNWAIRVQGFSDPRVRISQYSQLRIEKITDQDGNSLLPFLISNSTAMNTAVRPVISWSSSATFATLPGLRQIKEFRAGVALSILESERTITLDLTKPVVPIDTGRGQITVEQNAAGGFIIHITPVPDPSNTAARPSPVSIRTSDIAGRIVSTYNTTASQVNCTIPANVAAAEAEITWPDKTRDMVLPIELNDLTPAPVAGRAGAIAVPL